MAMPDDISQAAKIAGVAAASGAGMRVALAMHGGTRRVGLLLIEGMVGGCLGVMAAAGALYWDADLQHDALVLLKLGGAAGFCGALGTRLLDMVQAAVAKRLDVPPPKG
jgi:hypothetical protein